MKAVRSLFFAIVLILVLLVFKAPVFAQGNIPQATTTNYQTRDLNVWSQNVAFEVMSAFSCQLAGVNFSHREQKCLGFDPKTGQLGFVDNGGGALGLLTGGIAMLYTPPANTGNYVSYLSQNFGISKPSFAQSQGIGFDSINPLIGVWAVFRDISYLLFIFVFIIIGVAIMLRAKIDPRTVMTIQNQIPKLIIGIIMVTLSFAVAGLLIDLMWTSTYVVINVMGNADKNISTKKSTEQLYNHAIGYFDQVVSYGNQDQNQGFGGLFNLAQKGSGSIQETINSSFGQASPPNSQNTTPVTPRCNEGDIFCNGFYTVTDSISNVFQGGLNITNGVFKLVTGDWADLAANTVGGVLSGVVGFLVSWLIGGIAFFIILILLLWNLFKLWLFLLKCYVGILVDIIFAPFWILGGLIPGASSLGFTGWLKDLLGNLAVFPATIGVFLLAKLFVDISDTAKTEFFVPPLIGNFAGGIHTLGPLIALGFVLAAPHVAEGVKKSFKEKFSIDLSGAGESLKAAQGMGVTFLSTARKKFYYEYRDQQGVKHPTGVLSGPVSRIQRGATSKIATSQVGQSRPVRAVRRLLKSRNTNPIHTTPPNTRQRNAGQAMMTKGRYYQGGGGGTPPQSPTQAGGSTPASTGSTTPPQGRPPDTGVSINIPGGSAGSVQPPPTNNVDLSAQVQTVAQDQRKGFRDILSRLTRRGKR